MAITDQGRLSLAILISAIFEDENKDIIETAQQYISKNIVNFQLPVNPNLYRVNAVKLKVPFPVPELKEGKIEGKDLQVRLKLDDFQVTDVGEFTARKEKKCCLHLLFDYIKLSGVYSINGIVHGTEFNGSGNAEITLRDVTSEALIEHTFLDDDIADGRIKRLNFDFDFKLLEFEENGLAIKNLPRSEIRRILNSVGKVYFKQNMKLVSKKLSNTIKEKLNAILKDKNKVQIIELLQQGNIKL